MVMLNSTQQLKLDVISKVCDGRIDTEKAALILNKKVRTIFNYLKSYKQKGVNFVIHGNIGKTPINKTNVTLEQQVKKLILEKYHDFNMLHCLEKLLELEKIKIPREVFRRWCHEMHHVKKAKRRSSRARHMRARMEMAGLLLQMDGSPHRWFGGKESCLIIAIDDANSEVPYGEFFPAEDTISCMKVLQTIIEKKGLFEILYVDRAGIFGGPKRCNFSQVQRALQELGIKIIFANSAEGKGRVERTFNTLQDRLVPDLRLRKIFSYKAANSFLSEQYLPNEFNKKFMVTPKSLESAYRPIPANLNLKEIFCLKEYRTVARDHTISFNNETYSFASPIVYSIYKQKIEIRTYQDLTWKAFYADKEINVAKVEKPSRFREAA